MKENLLFILSNLSLLSAPSTRETPVQKWLNSYLQKQGYKPQGDAQGNLWCTDNNNGTIKCGIIAHADEIGIQLVSVEEPGIGKFRKIGGLRATSLIDHYVLFTNSKGENIKGLIGCDPMQNNGTESGIIVKTSDLWVDIGAESVEEFSNQLSVGDYATFMPQPIERLSENRIVGKAFDDRCGIAVSLCAFSKLVGELDNIELTFVSSAQEELNLFGAKALPIPLDIAIVIDVDFASDTPSSISNVTNLSIGKGIGICINADNNIILLKILKQVCKENSIPIQTTVGRDFSGGTDSASLRVKNATATVNISIPLRYMHNSLEMLDVRDLNYAAKAIIGLLEKLNRLNNLEQIIPWKN